MKTREELEDLAAKIGDLLDGDFSITAWNKAIQLLYDLHSEGMRDAAEIAIGTSLDDYGNLSYVKQQILAAIENKTKL